MLLQPNNNDLLKVQVIAKFNNIFKLKCVLFFLVIMFPAYLIDYVVVWALSGV